MWTHERFPTRYWGRNPILNSAENDAREFINAHRLHSGAFQITHEQDHRGDLVIVIWYDAGTAMTR